MLDESSMCIFPSLHIAAGQHSPLADGVAACVHRGAPEKHWVRGWWWGREVSLGRGASLQF